MSPCQNALSGNNSDIIYCKNLTIYTITVYASSIHINRCIHQVTLYVCPRKQLYKSENNVLEIRAYYKQQHHLTMTKHIKDTA